RLTPCGRPPVLLRRLLACHGFDCRARVLLLDRRRERGHEPGGRDLRRLRGLLVPCHRAASAIIVTGRETSCTPGRGEGTRRPHAAVTTSGWVGAGTRLYGLCGRRLACGVALVVAARSHHRAPSRRRSAVLRRDEAPGARPRLRTRRTRARRRPERRDRSTSIGGRIP